MNKSTREIQETQTNNQKKLVKLFKKAKKKQAVVQNEQSPENGKRSNKNAWQEDILEMKPR